MTKKEKKPTQFQIELLPWKSKRTPKDLPVPLPQPGKICWTLLGKRQSGKTLLLCNLIRAYRRQMDPIVILSPTLHLDPKWESVSHYDNVVGSDRVNDDVLYGIVQMQKERFDKEHPEDYQCLLVVDDAGNDFRRANLRQMMNVLYTTFRHYGGNLICGIQSPQHMESTQISNSTQWCIWDTNQRSLKKIATDLATSRMSEKALEEYIRENTKPLYSFVFIDYTAPPQETFRVGFGQPYIT
ncbi:hypothetical protein HDV00_009678 [Rhizophlyctis rosea]|nr:hypothetical protein HDV00_009678 [Rhizophlyctis rosea]